MRTANKYEQHKSEFRKVMKRLKELRFISWNEGWEELPKPQRYGWFKELALTKEVLRRHDSSVFEEILAACKIDTWAFEKKQLDHRWKVTYKNKKRQKPGLKKLKAKEFAKLSAKAKKHFTKEVNNSWRYDNEPVLYMCTLPRMFFDHKYRRAYVYRIQKLDAETASEIKQLENTLENKFHKLYYSSWKSRGEKGYRQKSVDAFKRKINMALNEVISDNIEREILYQDYKVDRF